MKISPLAPVILCLIVVSYCGRRSANEKKEPVAAEKTRPAAAGDTTTSSEASKNLRSSLSARESEFLLKAVDARMMGTLEGRAALKKGTTKEIRDYGALMIRDQQKMLAELKRLATELALTLPDTISDDKQDGLEDLLEKESKKFDKKFIKMMRIDHRRDVRLFSKAREFENRKIRAFATEYLPMVESHLEKIKGLKKQGKEKKPVVKV